MAPFGKQLLCARVSTRRAASGLFVVDVADGYQLRTYRGFVSATAARSTGRLVAESIGRVPLFDF